MGHVRFSISELQVERSVFWMHQFEPWQRGFKGLNEDSGTAKVLACLQVLCSDAGLGRHCFEWALRHRVWWDLA